LSRTSSSTGSTATPSSTRSTRPPPERRSCRARGCAWPAPTRRCSRSSRRHRIALVEARVVGPGEGPTIQGPAGGPLTFKVQGSESDGALTVFENVIAPGDGPPLHTHQAQDEAWYVL